MPLPADFDPDAAGTAEDGLFGLPATVDRVRVVVVPVPFEATVSYGTGTVNGPEAIRAASVQVDLFDVDTGRPYEQGIAMLDDPPEIRALNDEARILAEPVVLAGGVGTDAVLAGRAREVDGICALVNDWVEERVGELLQRNKLVFTVGGDHSVAYGAIAAHARRFKNMCILHFDAHYDLRQAYEGFTWSHASVMFNVLERIPQVSRILHVGIRDFGEREHAYSSASGGRSVAYPDQALQDRMAGGATWKSLVTEMVDRLPRMVYVSFDIDGLDPVLCPGTGTPVPGGLSFHQATSILAEVVRTGRRIVGGDLVEVAPQEGDREWNANVGARLLYKMIGYALKSG